MSPNPPEREYWCEACQTSHVYSFEDDPNAPVLLIVNRGAVAERIEPIPYCRFRFGQLAPGDNFRVAEEYRHNRRSEAIEERKAVAFEAIARYVHRAMRDAKES